MNKQKYLLKIIFILTVLCFNSCSRSNNLNIEHKAELVNQENIVGTWLFVKSTDKLNKTVDYFIQDYPGPDGNEIKVSSKGPNWLINQDGVYTKTFIVNDEIHEDVGHWKWISNNEIEFVMTIAQNSDQAYLIRETQKLLNKEWDTDAEGNYLDASSNKIIQLNENEMKVDYRNKYILHYQKQ